MIYQRKKIFMLHLELSAYDVNANQGYVLKVFST